MPAGGKLKPGQGVKGVKGSVEGLPKLAPERIQKQEQSSGDSGKGDDKQKK
jgi:hypothetical protein